MQGHGDPSRPPGDAGAGGAPVGGRSDPHPSPYDPPTLSHGLTMAAPGRDTLPERIGRYRVLSVLGEGGFGIVYQAQQEEPVRRRVALKVLKPGMDSRQVLARFQAEQQALALMDHPGVARVFDGGVTEQGRAYFAMEYVPGAPITEYCDLHRLDTRARIELFILVCQAVQHAHSKGVIHRDLKPSNVLVEVADGTPTPKVIDFGVAKAVNRNLTDRTLHTEMGQLIGTPEYMSPEQAEMTGLDIDTRTDVYALGVLLYELLTGALPFDPRSLRAKGFVEIQRIIREAEPPKPSTRLGSLAADDAAARATAHRRQTELSDLVRQLRGDLDWIIMKAMAKDRTRRYETTAQFAEDLRRFLTSQPVLARPPSVMYLSRKFVARHRWPIAAAAVALAMLAGGLVSTSILYSQAVEARAETQRKNEELQRQRDAAERSRADAEAARRVAEFQTYLTNVSIADAAVAADDYGWARARLEQSPAAMRDWEWRYLRSCTDRARHVIELPPGEALLAYSADSRRLLVAAPDGSLHLIDAATGRTERRSAPGGPAALAMAQG
ncbi:MAG: serine/threonine protein kinase, partial [Phycisphaeraceae bacterium]|nr:serine/threonine protein kinase [Phycisphaeraceae bacterium]